MNLNERGEVATPVDDPCQFNPAWRSIVAEFLFSSGVRSKEDMKSISMTGCIELAHPEGDSGSKECKEVKDREKKVAKKPKKKPKNPKNQDDVHKNSLVPVEPFYSHPEYRAFANDKWIASQLFMMDDESLRKPLTVENAPFRLAYRWFSEDDSEAALKKRLEPLLLTDASLDIITLDIVGVPIAQPAIEAYEKMYFNCRDENFEISKSLQLVTRFAMPWGPLKTFLKKWEEKDEEGFCIQDGRPIAKDSDVWRAIGATLGYEALIYSWGWEIRAHGIKDKSLKHKMEVSWSTAVSRIMQSLFTGDIKHEDAARVLAAYTAQLKFIDDSTSGKGGGGANDTTKALMDVLYLAAPKMVQFDEAESLERNEEIQSRIKSQLAISKQSIEDHGKQVEAEIIDAKISEAVEQ